VENLNIKPVSKHQKHANLAKPRIGNFGRTEVSILGTPCGEIKKLAHSIAKILAAKYSLAYVDADHKNSAHPDNLEGNTLQFGFQMVYTDKIDYNRFDTFAKQNKYLDKRQFADHDLILVNGNHFEASSQIVVVDPRKSLEKKLDKLTNVAAIVFQEKDQVIPDFLLEHIDGINNIPTFDIGEVEQIADLLSKIVKNNIPPIKGLVLAGGKSERMQRDKKQINYHGKAQHEFMFDLLNNHVSKTYFSVRKVEQTQDHDLCLPDSFEGLGPYGGILSAFRFDPNSAWLVTACDQPFLTAAIIKLLVEKRDPSKVATTFYNPATDFPEPLVTIWEPKAYAYLLHFLSLGYSCPRKVLINTDIELIKLADASVLRNVNTPQEYELAAKELGIT